MGLRADMTIQVARIDAHLLNRKAVTRLCYAGSVLHARPSGFHTTREPLQIGAEIYGHAGLEADIEIQSLALASVQLSGLSKVTLDLSHNGILHAILEDDERAIRQYTEIVGMLRSKDLPGLKAFTAGFAVTVRDALAALMALHGDVSVLQRARELLPSKPGITQALDELAVLAKSAADVRVNIDLADLSGYQYESGAMFALYVEGLPNAVARGGRYDHVGEAFGRARPATGFSMDLREVARLLPAAAPASAIRAPWGREPALTSLIASLRAQGEIVIQLLPGEASGEQEFDCDREIVAEGGKFLVKALQ
jgi:ATP phosphoribosyltransferase regulatory subunit